MGDMIKNEYSPDYITPPGETLLDTIKALGMSQVELAERIGRTPKTVNEIVRGKAVITPETAIQLERALGISASFWNNRQRRYDEFNARLAEARKLEPQIAWVDKFPYNRMAKFRWVSPVGDKVRRFQNLLNFFGVASVAAFEEYLNAMEIRYRKSNSLNADEYSLAAWLRCGEITARGIDCQSFNSERFRSCLKDIRSLTTKPASEFQPELVRICAACGVAVAFVRELPRTASGATRWLTPTKALIQLSLKYKTDDQLWFTFFHEAAHILRRQKKSIFLEGDKYESKEEKYANEFAAERLIPSRVFNDFVKSLPTSKPAIRGFAESIGIAPGIVVGRLQHENVLPWNRYNDLKRKLEWKSE